MCTLLVVVVYAIERVKEAYQTSLTKAFLEDENNTEIQDSHRISHDVQTRACQLQQRQLIGTLAIFVAHSDNVADGLHVHVQQYLVIRHEVVLINLALVDGCDFVGKFLERPQLEEATESVAIERHFVEIAVGHHRLNRSTVAVDFFANMAELLVGQFQHSSEASHIALVFNGNFHIALVPNVMVHVGPHMLQRAPHLQLKTYLVELRRLRIFIQSLRDATDIMERQITETVDFEHLTLVDGVVPVDFKQFLGQSGDDIDFIAIESDDTGTDNIGDVIQRVVFIAFQFQFTCKALLCLDTCFKSRNEDVILFKAGVQQTKNDGFQLLING